MPIFEYECRKCKKVFELLVSRKNEDKVECPHCGAKDPVKLISQFSASDGGAKDCGRGGECCGEHGGSHHWCGGGCGCGH